MRSKHAVPISSRFRTKEENDKIVAAAPVKKSMHLSSVNNSRRHT